MLWQFLGWEAGRANGHWTLREEVLAVSQFIDDCPQRSFATMAMLRFLNSIAKMESDWDRE